MITKNQQNKLRKACRKVELTAVRYEKALIKQAMGEIDYNTRYIAEVNYDLANQEFEHLLTQLGQK